MNDMEILNLAIRKSGSMRVLGERLGGVSIAAIAQWKARAKVPAKWAELVKKFAEGEMVV